MGEELRPSRSWIERRSPKVPKLEINPPIVIDVCHCHRHPKSVVQLSEQLFGGVLETKPVSINVFLNRRTGVVTAYRGNGKLGSSFGTNLFQVAATMSCRRRNQSQQ